VAGPTPSQTIGPFFHLTLGSPGPARMVADDHPGAKVLAGRVLDGAGDGVSDALVELWDGENFARCHSETDGGFSFVVDKPPPLDGAPHFAVSVFARGLLGRLVTRCYFPDEAANATDPVLTTVAPERRDTLIAASDSDGLRFDICLQGERETVFFAL
jgi:protocatechuate 3,4-dioxygenase, alpha subunit